MSALQNVFCAGSAAVCTVTVVHPIDTIKTRLQVSGTAGARNYAALGMMGTIKTVAAEEGIAAFWKGIPAAWLREGSYTSLRLGLYKPIKKLFRADKPDSHVVLKFAAGGAAGGLGSIAGNPFDVLKTRMMASEGASVGLGAVSKDIYATSGVGGFYKGMDANVARAVVNNGTKMLCYDLAKTQIKDSTGMADGVVLQACASMIAGFAMTVTVAPFDISRTRLMNQPAATPGSPPLYSNLIDCATKIVRAEGPLTLWRGFFPMWMRIAPNNTIQLLLFEQISRAVTGESGV